MSEPNFLPEHCPNLARDCDAAAAAGVQAAQQQPACILCRTPLPGLSGCTVFWCEDCYDRHGDFIWKAMERAMLAARADQHARDHNMISQLSHAHTAQAIEITALRAAVNARDRFIGMQQADLSRAREQAAILESGIRTLESAATAASKKLRNRTFGEIAAALILAACWGLWLLL